MRPAAGRRAEGTPSAQPRAAELAEAGFADPESLYGSGGIHAPLVEVGEDAEDKFGRQPMDELLLFTPVPCRAARRPPPQKERSRQGRLSHAQKPRFTFVPSPVHFCSGPDTPQSRRWRTGRGRGHTRQQRLAQDDRLKTAVQEDEEAGERRPRSKLYVPRSYFAFAFVIARNSHTRA